MDDQTEVVKHCDYGSCLRVVSKYYISRTNILVSKRCDKHKPSGIKYFDTKEEAQLWFIKSKL